MGELARAKMNEVRSTAKSFEVIELDQHFKDFFYPFSLTPKINLI